MEDLMNYPFSVTLEPDSADIIPSTPNPGGALAGKLIDLGSMQKFDESVADDLSSGSFLPRLQFMSSASKECKDGSFPINSYAFVAGSDPIDMGKEVDIIPLVWRPKALDMSGEEVITSFDTEDNEFVRIKAQSKEKDSGCMYGFEYLIWIPENGKFATFFMGTKTSRRDAPNLSALLGSGATLKSKKIDTGKYVYYSPSILPCSAPLTTPDVEDLAKQVEDFNNPQVKKVERVESDPVETDGRVQ